MSCGLVGWREEDLRREQNDRNRSEVDEIGKGKMGKIKGKKNKRRRFATIYLYMDIYPYATADFKAKLLFAVL